MAYDNRYNYMEPTLQEINRDYIQWEEALQAKNNKLVTNVLEKLITKMRDDKLFNELYSAPYYGGSYYCGLKVGQPDEYDLDMLLRLPLFAQPQMEVSDEHAFVRVQCLNMVQFDRNIQLSSRYPNFKKYLLDKNDYLVTNKVLSWIESLVNKALNSLQCIISANDTVYEVELRKQGPAFTLLLFSNRTPAISIDLVPCFAFKSADYWPQHSYRNNPVPQIGEFFIVPKKPRSNYLHEPFRYWRISFTSQENVLINNGYFLKSAVKLLKKLRDEFDHKAIASYYIKTIFLWEYELGNINWRSSLSCVFMTMLKKYQAYIEKGFIPDYWNAEYNLIGHVSTQHLQVISNTLQAVIRDIDNNLGNPDRIRRYFTRTVHLKESALTFSNGYVAVEPVQPSASYCAIL